MEKVENAEKPTQEDQVHQKQGLKKYKLQHKSIKSKDDKPFKI